MIKIAFVIDTIETAAAGTEKQLLMLLNGLDRTKFKPYLICLRDSDWLKSRTFSFNLVKYDLQKLASFRFLMCIFQFIKLHRKERFDITQTFFLDANIFGTVAARLAGCKIIISGRRNMSHWNSKLHLFILRFLRRWTDFYLSNSEAAAKSTAKIEGINPAKIKVIYNGLNLDLFRLLHNCVRTERRAEWGVADDETLIGAVANLRSVKNISSLIMAAWKLLQKFDKLKFVVIGEGDMHSELQNLVDKLELTTRFKLVGRYNHIPPCLSAFDIAVLCSESESFSNSLIEYMAAGLPLVASDVGGNSEAIIRGETGLLYSIDDENGLTEALELLLTNRSRALEFGTYAKARAFREYDRENAIRIHEEYYQDILHGSSKKAELRWE